MRTDFLNCLLCIAASIGRRRAQDGGQPLGADRIGRR
jgi:hypothetical protein